MFLLLHIIHSDIRGFVENSVLKSRFLKLTELQITWSNSAFVSALFLLLFSFIIPAVSCKVLTWFIFFFELFFEVKVAIFCVNFSRANG